MDGLNVHGRTKDLTLIGYGASDLDDYARDAAGEQGRIIRPDPEPEKGFYYRSDHFNFAKQGVPALDRRGRHRLRRQAGRLRRTVRDDYTEHDYHKPTDVVRPRLGFERRARGPEGVSSRSATGSPRPTDARVEAGQRVQGKARGIELDHVSVSRTRFDRDRYNSQPP